MRDMQRTFEKDGFTVIVTHEYDDSPDTSYLEQEYEDCTPEEREQYKQQDRERLEALRNGDWYYLGVCVAMKKGSYEVGRASVWGIESDSDEGYFTEIEDDLITEAFAEVARLRAAIA
jgi:hypothetical protein